MFARKVRVEDVCRCIDQFEGHMIRVKNQERFWPSLLHKMRAGKMYGHIAIKVSAGTL